MKWSWKIGQLAGIAVYVHATFAILIVWIAMVAWQENQTIQAVVMSVAFIIALFACIVLHELGHALAARQFGIQTRDITLLPIGGLARLERMPEKPSQEFLVALAGPAVNAAIAVLLAAALYATGNWNLEAGANLVSGPFLQRLVAVNLFIMGFNLLPAFPMDGGRALRALLATRVDYVAATQIAANLGQAMAFFFGLLGLFGNPFLLFIALFVWIGAAAEASMAQVKAALGGIPVAQAMLTRFESVSSREPLARAVELTLAGSQKDFPVVDGEILRGVLTQERLLSGLAKGSDAVPISSVLVADVPCVDSHEMLEEALARFDGLSGTTLPVTHGGALVGLLTMDNVGEFLRIRAALDSTSSATISRTPRSSAED